MLSSYFVWKSIDWVFCVCVFYAVEWKPWTDFMASRLLWKKKNNFRWWKFYKQLIDFETKDVDWTYSNYSSKELVEIFISNIFEYINKKPCWYSVNYCLVKKVFFLLVCLLVFIILIPCERIKNDSSRI